VNLDTKIPALDIPGLAPTASGGSNCFRPHATRLSHERLAPEHRLVEQPACTKLNSLELIIMRPALALGLRATRPMLRPVPVRIGLSFEMEHNNGDEMN
jgi:hypothetical protein